MESFAGSRVLVTGGAGFIGSHLVDRLLADGAKVVVVDNLITGRKENLAAAKKSDLFTFIEGDVSGPVENYLPKELKFDFIFHLASPASPVDFVKFPKEIYSVNAFGTHYLCEYAVANGARLVFASTSEAYGDPLEHPQKETYFGNVNPVGPRACYDESKRFGEMIVSTQTRQADVDGRIVRIFNTYGPRMRADDGRVVPAFITQALAGMPLTVHGNGSQTRSFCYVDDLVEYLLRSMIVGHIGGEVINIGNHDERTMIDFAREIVRLTQSNSEIEFIDRPEDDPEKRRPDLSKAKKLLDYSTTVSLEDGLIRTIDYFRRALA